ncbi:DUF3533 domain-containing protein [Pseudonocardiaceae bacterium YIM PH 21723]|nr:DUF3533 domain-containing protein [Pseudonocardiaceae bacterium YIM PH 21723]
MRATALLRSPRIWVFTVLGALMALLVTFGYLGGALDSSTSPGKRVPIAWVNADKGPTGTDLTKQITEGQAADAANWVVAQDEDDARRMLSRDEVYAAVLLPADLTARLQALADPRATPQPVKVTVLTNPIAGPAANGTATAVSDAVLHKMSLGVGEKLLANPAAANIKGAARLELSDPISTTKTPWLAPPEHSANGLAAFYYSVVLLMTGFLLSQLLHSGVDGVAGFAPRELLHRRQTKAPLPIDRTHTLLTKTGLLAGCSLVAASVIELLAVQVLEMPTAHAGQLWLFSVLAVLTGGMLPLTLLAIFGTPGTLVATALLLIFGVPSSGGPFPPELQPPFFRTLGHVLPLRYTTDGARDLIFDTAGGGLRTGVPVLGAWLLGSLLLGLMIARLYDRNGLHRTSEHERLMSAPA